MRQRLIASSLFLTATFAFVACGSPFQAGHGGGADTTDDAGDDSSLAAEGPDGSTVVVPPNQPGPSTGGDGGTDASPDAHEDAGHEIDATVDANDDATANEPPDAAGNPPDSSTEHDAGPTCTSTQKLCGTECVEKSSAATGCAATSCAPCSLEHTATATCDANGACAVETCASGFDHCTGPASGGCETPISTSTNCGSCGHACTVADPDCAASGNTFACTDNCPVATPTLCSNACVDTTSNPADCGGCASASSSYVCTAPTNGTPTCAASTCGFNCNTGFDKCNDDECVSFTTDPTNCNGCGTKCPVPTHGTATCAPVAGTGTCGIACTSPYSVCNGVCDDEQTDVNNCGACGNPCPVPAHGSATCAPNGNDVGTCGIACTSPYSVCGSACVDEQTDTNNCGGCTSPTKSYACTPPANATATCAPPAGDPSGPGACGFTCVSGYQLCNGACYQADPTAAFVSSSSSATSGCGAIGSPCKTIAAGIAYATANGKTHIYVDHGTYAEQVTLTNGLTIEGGWEYGGGSAWSKECVAGVDQSSVTILAPTSVSSAVIAKDVTATLSTLTIHNDTTASTGESLFGILAESSSTTNDTSLTLDAVEVTVAAGGNGSVGGVGSVPSVPSANVPPCASGSGAVGATVTAVSGLAASSQYTSAGLIPGAGKPGASGNAGSNGTPGGAAPTTSAGGCNTGTICNSGGNCDTGPLQCGVAGTNGCGGPGGPPGLGGGGGGSSIALFAWEATVHVVGGSLVSGQGGSGGAGGNGTELAAVTSWTGMKGAVGAGGDVWECRAGVDNCSQGATGPAYKGGSAGGNGGLGSPGGAGVSGPGGDSFAYYSGTGASVTLSSSPTTTPGAAGTSPGPNASNSGTSAAHN